MSPELRAARAMNMWAEVAEAAAANGKLRGAIHELQGSGLRRCVAPSWRQWRTSRRDKVRAVRHWAALAARERRGALAALTLAAAQPH